MHFRGYIRQIKRFFNSRITTPYNRYFLVAIEETVRTSLQASLMRALPSGARSQRCVRQTVPRAWPVLVFTADCNARSASRYRSGIQYNDKQVEHSRHAYDVVVFLGSAMQVAPAGVGSKRR